MTDAETNLRTLARCLNCKGLAEVAKFCPECNSTGWSKEGRWLVKEITELGHRRRHPQCVNIGDFRENAKCDCIVGAARKLKESMNDEG